MNKEKNKKLRFIVGYIIGLIIIILMIYYSDRKSIKTAFQPNLLFLLYFVLASVLMNISMSVKWGYITNKIEKRKVCSYFTYFFYFVCSVFLGSYISQMGGNFILKPALLNKRNNVPFKNGVLAVFLEKAIDISFLFILVIPFILLIFKMLSAIQVYFLIGIIICFTFYILIFKNEILIRISKRMLSIILLITGKIPYLKKVVKQSYFDKINNLDKFSLFSKKALFVLLLLTLMKYIFIGLRLYCLGHALNLNIPFIVFLAGIPISQFSLLLGITPGALGILEGGWYAVFKLFNINNNYAVSFIIAQRLYQLIFSGIIFLITYVIFMIRNIIKKENILFSNSI